MAGSSSPSLVDSLFQRSLDDLIKTLRSQPIGEATLLSKTLNEIRREIRTTDLETKSVALQKLTYISSLHSIDMSWASFHALELLPSPSFLHKKLAYLAASLSFHSSTDVLLLITNQLRKDLTGHSDLITSLALEFLAVAATPDLARDLTPEVFTLLASSKPAVRKKATAVVLRIFNKYPDSVRVAFKRLVENLECADQKVLSAGVGVFCELLAADPGSYLPLAPEFYRILVDCKNNWVLIKVLKIFARLVPLEPRLGKRVVDSVCEHMRRSMAKSLVFECIRTVLLSLDDFEHAVRLAVDKIREFLASEDDSNLRYIGLRALSMLRPGRSWAVEENREAVVKSLSDSDPNIQREALRLVMGMVTESNIIEICLLLVNYALKSDPGFCNEIIGLILSTCGRNYYELITDFDWYVSLLGEMARNPHCMKGEEIEQQLVDIGLRVKDARPELVRVTRDLLIDPALLGNHFLCRVLSSAAWISGEYTEFSRNPWELVEALLQPRTNLLPPLVRAVYLQAVFKILLFCLNSYIEQLEAGQFYSGGDLDSGSPILGNSDAHQFIDESSGMASKDAIASHELDSGSQIPGDSDTVRSDAVANHQLNDESSGMASKDAIASQETTSMLGSAETRGPFTYESIERMLNLVETAVGPLSECDEVEVQERARNVLGLIHMLQEIRSCNFEEDLKKDAAITEIIRLMHGAFTEELGLVSANAQERVPIPDGLILREDLSELATVLGNDDAMPHFSSSSFSLQNIHDRKIEEESAPLTDSNLLLSEHRKRHGLYYLPTEKIELENNDYPHVNDPGFPVNSVNFTGDATEDLLKLTDQSLVPKKTKQVKPRPVVVKLEEGQDVAESALKLVEPKDDLLSGAVRDVLLDNKGKSTLSGEKSSDKSNRRRVKEDINLNSTSTSQSKENLGDTELGSPNTRRSRHQSHGKIKQRSSRENKDKEEKNNMNSSRSSRHHGRHKHRQRGDDPLNVVPQTPVIQDFLL